ncbi:MAG TPA: type III pantothenate kinase [Methylophilus sp.]|nr:type III pantothenate kinase [Methylophilus sp.]HQQ33800.1 type III pantothenate kinase [Methylophilus sp.]
MTLLVDIGNSRTKWAFKQEGGVLGPMHACENADIANHQDLRQAVNQSSRIVLACVAGEDLLQQFKTLVPKKTALHVMQPQAETCGVFNGYEKPQTLGVDRWAALLGAWGMHRAPCLVVNAGTAITVDALNAEGEFLGGTISPGLGLMLQSLKTNTARLNVDINAIEDEEFPVRTSDAMYMGCLNAAVGAIGTMAMNLARHCGAMPEVVLSGGNAQVLKNALQRMPFANLHVKSVIMTENLVLQGLALWEKEIV